MKRYAIVRIHLQQTVVAILKCKMMPSDGVVPFHQAIPIFLFFYIIILSLIHNGIQLYNTWNNHSSESLKDAHRGAQRQGIGGVPGFDILCTISFIHFQHFFRKVFTSTFGTFFLYFYPAFANLLG